jgi:hypothetical protein
LWIILEGEKFIIGVLLIFLILAVQIKVSIRLKEFVDEENVAHEGYVEEWKGEYQLQTINHPPYFVQGIRSKRVIL